MIPPAQREEILRIQGWFERHEGDKLAELAANVHPAQAIVEIGAFAGRSTCFLAAGALNGRGAHLTSIDPWGPAAIPDGTDQGAADEILEDYRRNLEAIGVQGQVTTLRATAEQVAPMWIQPIGLLFLDATHLYEDTLREIRDWGPHVVAGGHAAFHDYHRNHPGVVQALDEVVEAGGWEHKTLVRSLRVLRRTP